MRNPRIYTPQPLAAGADVELDEQRSHYLLRVLRLPLGASLRVFNGDGLEYPAELSTAGKKLATVSLANPLAVATESPLHTVLGLGISRGERMDYAIQKSTELGVSIIVPLLTEHCEVKLSGKRVDKRLEHWRQVSISACEQCGRVRPPHIETPLPLTQWLGSELPPLKLLFDHQQDGLLPSARPEQGVALLIGPEGGFSEAETAQARSAGFKGIALGTRVLRTETAPVAALAVLQYLWEGQGSQTRPR